MVAKSRVLLIFFIIACLGRINAASAQNDPPPADPQLNRIYQFFVLSPEATKRPNLGAYLWIPPNTVKIRAVMIGYHNGLPINILQSAAVRAVCRKHGIAQILLTPWAKDIGTIMDGFYDVTDPARTSIYDRYINDLAELSGHPELVAAPIVPMGHSAYCEFPFDAAIRNPEQCLAAIPIKAGLPNVYDNYVAGKAKSPTPDMCLRNVPILFIGSGSQETVSWSAYPHGFGGAGTGNYRRDHDDNPGTAYEARNELFGNCWDMTSGHFDMLPRNYQFVADWLDTIATARLPEEPGAPLKNLFLKDGWLTSASIPPTGDLPNDFPMPAAYLDYKGHRNQALWFPSEDLAKRLFTLGRDEPRKQIEFFTFLGADNQPISLAHGAMAPYPNAIPHDDGLLTLTTYHYIKPPDICTVDHKKHPDAPHVYSNVLFPGKTELPTSDLPLRFDPHNAPIVLVKAEPFKDDRGVMETRFTLRLIRHRISPDAGSGLSFVRIFHEGNDRFAAAGRTSQISLSGIDSNKTAKPQTVEFAPVADAPASASRIELKAKSSSGLPVEFFVFKGPGVIRDGVFVPTEVPAGAGKPIEVTVGAYQNGMFKETDGIKPSPTVYQTFHLIP